MAKTIAQIKTADERIAEAKVAMERVQEAYVDLAVQMEKLRLIFIALNESPVMIELAESEALWELDDEPKWEDEPIGEFDPAPPEERAVSDINTDSE